MNTQVVTSCTPNVHSYADAAFERDNVKAPGINGVIADESSPPLRCGYGACSKPGCNCQGYEGNASTCGNTGCGHSYSDHW
jgi:hypothetical protein